MSANEASRRVTLAPGERVELWTKARGDGAVLRVELDGAKIYEVPRPAARCEFHRFECDGGDVEFVWTPALLDFPFAYSYRPATALAEGIKLWEFEAGGIKQWAGKKLAAMLRAEPGRPQLHFSPPRQWMNDPNGLCLVDGRWHLFYQFHPGGTEWGPMHWGHAVSEDLLTWTHLPVFLHPQHDLPRLGASGGAFSGCAFAGPDGQIRFCHTERLPCYDDTKWFREVQRVVEAPGLLAAAGGRTVLAERPAAAGMDFRDPRAWWHEPAGAYRMVLGGAVEGDPALLLYGSKDMASWDYLGPLWRADAKWREQGATAAECPDFFELDGRWALVASMLGHVDPATGRRNPILALGGEFKDDVFTPDTDHEPQVLDFGSDFYAMQSCAGDGRRIAFGWLHNWTNEDAAPDARHRGEQSLPRELGWDGHGQLRMAPIRELDDEAKVKRTRIQVWGSGKLIDAPFEFRVRNIRDGMTTFTATAEGKEVFKIEAGCEDEGKPTKASIILPGGDACHGRALGTGELRIIYDRGVIEVFAAGGSCCGTRRIHPVRPPDAFELNVASGQGELWRLEPPAP